MTGLRCPCGGVLMAGPSSAGLLAGCERCGGTWLDHEELALLARDSVTLESAAFIRAIDTKGVEVAAQGSAYRTASRPKGGCPSCGKTLVETPLQGGVNVDVCDTHGTFFDRTEIRILRFEQAMSKAWAETAVLQARERKHKAAEAAAEAERRRQARERFNNSMMNV
ncbi:MAG: Zn-finger nucleic acid-binding protein [Polyangiales bacterium]